MKPSYVEALRTENDELILENYRLRQLLSKHKSTGPKYTDMVADKEIVAYCVNYENEYHDEFDSEKSKFDFIFFQEQQITHCDDVVNITNKMLRKNDLVNGDDIDAKNEDIMSDPIRYKICFEMQGENGTMYEIPSHDPLMTIVKFIRKHNIKPADDDVVDDDERFKAYNIHVNIEKYFPSPAPVQS